MCQWFDEFQKIRTFFFSENRAPGIFGAPDCHPSTLIDLIKIDVTRKRSVETICLISESYRTHRAFTGPMNFKKSGHFFFGKSCSRDFGAPGCHPDTSIDLANIALASTLSRGPIGMISEGYRTHRGVTGSMNFKKNRMFFSENRAPGILGPLAAIQAH